jgi:hypothetical protein
MPNILDYVFIEYEFDLTAFYFSKKLICPSYRLPWFIVY